jgi:hypothetical protein
MCEAMVERLAQDLEDLTPARRAFAQEAHGLVRPRPLARQRIWPPIRPTSEIM